MHHSNCAIESLEPRLLFSAGPVQEVFSPLPLAPDRPVREASVFRLALPEDTVRHDVASNLADLGPRDGDGTPTGERFMLFDRWGGTWTDVNQTLGNTDDDRMCWAGAAANMLAWTGWGDAGGMAADAEAIFTYFQDRWSDAPATVDAGMQWWFDGTELDREGWSEVELAGGGFYSTEAFNRSFIAYNGTKEFDRDGSRGSEEAISRMMSRIDRGYAISLGISRSNKGHAINVWGYNIEPDTGRCLGIWISDPADSRYMHNPTNRLRYFEVDHANGQLKNYRDFDDWVISDMYALEQIRPAGTPPVLAPLGEYSVSFEDEPLVIDLSVTEPDGDALHWSVRPVFEGNIVGRYDYEIDGDRLIVTPTSYAHGEVDIEVTVSDVNGADTRRVTLVGADANLEPEVEPVDDIDISYRPGTTTVIPIEAFDRESSELDLTARINRIGTTPYHVKGYFGIVAYDPSFDNFSGLNEKWFRTVSGTWCSLRPDGTVYGPAGQRFDLSSYYHDHPEALVNAGMGHHKPKVDLSFDGRDLRIEVTEEFWVSFDVRIAVSDGFHTGYTTFKVTPVDMPLTFEPIDDRTVSVTHDRFTVSLNAADPDDPVSYTAETIVDGATADPASTHGLQEYAPQWDNYLGKDDKWIRAADGGWFYIVPDGTLYDWLTRRAVARPGPAAYADTNRLFEPPSPSGAPGDVTLSIDGDTLTIDPADGFGGSFQVAVTASAGGQSIERTFAVDVTNLPPELTLPDIVIPAGHDTRQVTMPAVDAEGQTIEYSAALSATDTVAVSLRDRLGLAGYESRWDNWLGLNEKWLRSDSGGWAYIIPDGSMYGWVTHSVEGAVNTRYWDDPTLLLTAAETTVPDSLVAADITGNILTLDPAAGYSGSFTATITATDGTNVVEETFGVTVA